MVTGIIFDFDGVICDSMTLHTAIHQKILQAHGKHLTLKELEQYAGVPVKDLYQTVLQKSEPVSLMYEEYNSILLRDAPAIIKPIDGIKELLEQLHDVPKAIGSSSNRAFILLCLQVLQLEHHFKHIVSIDDVKKGKPDPEIFLKAAEHLGLQPAQCTVIEDGIAGMLAAKRAGMYCIGLVDDTSQEYPADKLVTSLHDIDVDKIHHH